MAPRSPEGRPRPRRPEAGRPGLSRFARDERGAAAVEFAILLPVLCALLLGMIDYGYYFFLNSTAVNAAREGARAGVVETNQTAAESTAQTVASNYLTAANIRLGDCDNCASVSAVYDSGSGNLETTVTIDPYEPLTGFLPASAFPASATHTSSMRIEGFLP